MSRVKENTKDFKSFELKNWQKCIVDAIDGHDDLVSGQDWQSLGQFDVNRLSSVSVAMPRAEGHSTLTAYIASKYNAAVVYFDMPHWNQIQRAAGKFGFAENPNSSAISVYELFYAMANSHSEESSIILKGVKERLANKQVLVVDRASELPAGVKDNLLNLSQGMVVFLG